MKRGEIYYANLSPAVGSEMDKRRPILVDAAIKLHLDLD
jgi:mRNA interferase MazF